VFRKLQQSQLVFDIVAPSVLFLLCALPFFAAGPDWLFVLFGMCAALVFRRWAPGIALAIAWGTAVVQMGIGATPNPANLAILVVLAGTGAYGGSVVRWLGLASVPLGAIAITFYLAVLPYVTGDLQGNPWVPEAPILTTLRYASIVFISSLVAFGLAWTVGQLMRTSVNARESRRAAVEAEQEVVTEQERTRIARDMHDVVAHSLAVVVAQADGARYLLASDPKATEQALLTIAGTAREALSDVRVLLAQLRYHDADGPQPTLVDLDRLIQQLESAGLTVRRETSGDPLPFGTAQQLAVYRIVQEALTNALRHADTGQDVVLRFAWTAHGLDLTISSALGESADRDRKAASYGPAHGIAGMTERAVLVGGRLSAAPDGDRFVVHAWLPAAPAGSLPTGAVPTVPAQSAGPDAAAASATSEVTS
jgi:signal transduction histidine kinase